MFSERGGGWLKEPQLRKQDNNTVRPPAHHRYHYIALYTLQYHRKSFFLVKPSRGDDNRDSRMSRMCYSAEYVNIFKMLKYIVIIYNIVFIYILYYYNYVLCDFTSERKQRLVLN